LIAVCFSVQSDAFFHQHNHPHSQNKVLKMLIVGVAASSLRKIMIAGRWALYD
jgi:hypothetical protein